MRFEISQTISDLGQTNLFIQGEGESEEENDNSAITVIEKPKVKHIVQPTGVCKYKVKGTSVMGITKYDLKKASTLIGALEV